MRLIVDTIVRTVKIIAASLKEDSKNSAEKNKKDLNSDVKQGSPNEMAILK